MSTVPATTLVLLAGGAVSAAIYWGFLNTPESAAWTIALSALLLLAVVLVGAASIGTVLLAWYSGRVSRPVVVGALRGLPAFVLPALLVIAVWWVVGLADAWVASTSGEISAWFIARLDWSDVGWLFTTHAWVSLWLRWVVAPFMALVWWRTILVRGWKPTGALLREALHPARVLTATAIVAVLVWLPWTQLAPWRPPQLAPGTGELVFVGAKLGFVTLLSALGWSLVARTAARPGARA